MIFNKKNYYNYTRLLENVNYFIYLAYIVTITFTGLIFLNIKGALIGMIITSLTGYPFFLHAQIKIEEMKWRIDIHDMLNKNNNIKDEDVL